MKSIRRITLATQNEGKRRELAQLAKHLTQPLQLEINPAAPEIEETGSTFQENALLKAQQSPPLHAGDWVLAEDSGLIVDALDGQFGLSPFPGIYANRWLMRERYDTLMANWAECPAVLPAPLATDRLTENGMSNTELCLALLALMAGKPERRARYCCAMALWNPERGTQTLVEKSLELWVTEKSTLVGSNGFGYDPIMHVYDTQNDKVSSHTLAELSLAEKNAISHRSQAFLELFSGLFK
jgi:XTP/dITP diphosphohydrolase